MDTDKKYSVKLKAGHPTGTMRRAGLIITRESQIVSLSDEQLQLLQNDRYIIVEEAQIYQPAYQPEAVGDDYQLEGEQKQDEEVVEPQIEQPETVGDEVRINRKDKKKGKR